MSDTPNTVLPELLANTMTTIMVRGLFSNLEFPYVYFPGRKVAGYMLYEPLWEAVARLESNSLKVHNVQVKPYCTHVHCTCTYNKVKITVHFYVCLYLGYGMHC